MAGDRMDKYLQDLCVSLQACKSSTSSDCERIEKKMFIREVMKPCKGLGLNLYCSVIFDELFSCSLACSFSESRDVLFRAACIESRLLKCRVTKLFFIVAIIMLGRQKKRNRSWACSAFLHAPSPSSQNSIPRWTPFLNMFLADLPERRYMASGLLGLSTFLADGFQVALPNQQSRPTHILRMCLLQASLEEKQVAQSLRRNLKFKPVHLHVPSLYL